MHQGYIELERSLGIGGGRQFRDRALEEIHKEERRQSAQYRFGMRDKPPKSIDDDPF